MSALHRLQTAVSFVYPPRCLSCGTVVDSNFGLCGTCWRDTGFIGGAICDACGVPLPGEAAPELSCDTCLGTPRPWDQGRAAFLYKDIGRKLVLALKHGDRQEIARPAALWMAAALKDILPLHTLVIPVPLHWTRLLKRRYNQSALLSAALADHMGLGHCPDVLTRPRRTPSLDGMSKHTRFEVLANAIKIHPSRKHRIAARPVLLVDDVMTSGATLMAATNACLAAGSGPVRIVTLARVDKDA